MNDLFQVVDEFNRILANASKPYFDFPKYNVLKNKDGTYSVDMALAGFDKSELSVKVSQGAVEISGVPADSKSHRWETALFRGIAMKPFKVKMAIPLGATVGGVKFDNGILSFEFGEDKVQSKELEIK